jgi:hypothetical protein
MHLLNPHNNGLRSSIVVGSTVAGTAIMGTTVFLNRKEYEDLQESSDSKNVSDTDVVHTKSPKNTKHGPVQQRRKT